MFSTVIGRFAYCLHFSMCHDPYKSYPIMFHENGRLHVITLIVGCLETMRKLEDTVKMTEQAERLPFGRVIL